MLIMIGSQTFVAILLLFLTITGTSVFSGPHVIVDDAAETILARQLETIRSISDNKQGVSERSRVDNLINLFDIYKLQHSIHAMYSESDTLVCARKFVKIRSISCAGIGNGLGQHLHGLVMAMLLNRTVIVEHINCANLISWSDWVANISAVQTRLQSTHCSYDFQAPDSRCIVNREYACDIDQSNETVLLFQALQNRAFDHFNNISGARFGPEMTWRRDVMFSCPTFENSRFEIYGFLLSTFFKYSELIVDRSSVSWGDSIDHYRRSSNRSRDGKWPSSSVSIGVHIRHQSVKENISIIDKQFQTRILNILQSLDYTECSLLIASDREETVSRMHLFAASIPCHVREVAKVKRCDSNDPLHDCPDHKVDHEHGPWAGPLMTISDFLFLGQSDFFVGSLVSTYSQLIADLVAANNALKLGDNGSDHIYWVPAPNKGKYYHSLVNANICRN